MGGWWLVVERPLKQGESQPRVRSGSSNKKHLLEVLQKLPTSKANCWLLRGIWDWSEWQVRTRYWDVQGVTTPAQHSRCGSPSSCHLSPAGNQTQPNHHSPAGADECMLDSFTVWAWWNNSISDDVC